jgi:Trk K+ transport system NAD-binding subunit/Kef-type K+ transport system membrane component KefB
MPTIDIPSVVVYTAIFLLIALASKQVGAFFSKYGLPYITGYLLTGMFAGPFLLEMMPEGATDELYFIDDISLAVIAFIAGSELYLKELQNRLRGILLNLVGIVFAGLVLIGIAIYTLAGSIDFIAELPAEIRIASALLGATVLLALSPASTIAVMQEVRARGPFSKTVLSVTVVMDVIIIVLFAISVAIASTLVDGDDFNVGFIGILMIDIAIALVAGYIVSLILRGLLSTQLPMLIQVSMLLLLGFLIFEGGSRFTEWSADNLPFKIKIEPLLISMVAGFSITNFSPYRRPFEALLHDISPYVYVAFFTLTGVALKLDILIESILIAGALFFARMLAILIGSYVGGTIAGEPETFRRYAWLGLITQAGIALGLAREAAVEFPSLGDEFATLIIAVVVLNEIFGPLLLKYALRQTGDAHEAAKPTDEDDGVRDVVILGVEPQSIALARQLNAHDWHVTLADNDHTYVKQLVDENLQERHIEDFSEETLKKLIKPTTDAVVALLDDDEANIRACEIAYEHAGVRNIITYLRDMSLAQQLNGMNVRVVDPASAMVNLIDQYVRVPASMELLMHQDPDYDVTQIRVTESDVDGLLLRDLRLPNDVLVLEITRDGHSIVPSGYTAIRRQDEVTLVGSPESLKEVTLRLGY